MKIDHTKRVSTTDTHLFFWGSIYSQWAKTPFEFEGVRYNTAEQFMMAMKARLFDDPVSERLILESKNPSDQKAIGRAIKRFDEQVWNDHRLSIVVAGNYLKFSQNPNLADELLSTGSLVLVEGSPKDRIWGVGLAWDDPRIIDTANWKGLNLLGVALMSVRDRLSGEKNNT